jgi:hypothetical protein
MDNYGERLVALKQVVIAAQHIADNEPYATDVQKETARKLAAESDREVCGHTRTSRIEGKDIDEWLNRLRVVQDENHNEYDETGYLVKKPKKLAHFRVPTSLAEVAAVGETFTTPGAISKDEALAFHNLIPLLDKFLGGMAAMMVEQGLSLDEVSRKMTDVCYATVYAIGRGVVADPKTLSLHQEAQDKRDAATLDIINRTKEIMALLNV